MEKTHASGHDSGLSLRRVAPVAVALGQLGTHLVDVYHGHHIDSADTRLATRADGRVAPVAYTSLFVAVAIVLVQMLERELEAHPSPCHQRRADLLVQQRAQRTLDLVPPDGRVHERQHAHRLDRRLRQLVRPAARRGRAPDAARLEHAAAEPVHGRNRDAEARRDDLRLVRVVHNALAKPCRVADAVRHSGSILARPACVHTYV